MAPSSPASVSAGAAATTRPLRDDRLGAGLHGQLQQVGGDEYGCPREPELGDQVQSGIHSQGINPVKGFVEQ